MNRRSSHAVPLSEKKNCQLAALDKALRFLLRPSLPQSCGWPPLRSDKLFEEILLCVILHADWLSRLEGHSCIIFMATKNTVENNRGQSAFKHFCSISEAVFVLQIEGVILQNEDKSL